MATRHLAALIAALLITLGPFAVTVPLGRAGAMVHQTTPRLPLSPHGPSMPFTVEGATAFRWIRQFGTSVPDEATAVAVDASRVYVAGITGNSPDVFLRKYDLDGNVVWIRQFGTTAEDFAQAVAVDGSGVYVAGYTRYPDEPGFTDDAFLWKYDLDGNVVWNRTLGTPQIDYANAVAVDASGAYVGGLTFGTLPGETGAGTAFIRKYDPSGSVMWTRQFGTTNGGGYVWALAVLGSDVYVVGSTRGGTFPGEQSGGGDDAFVRRYDPAGTELWTHQFGTSGSDMARGAAADTSSLYVAGVTDGTFPGQTSAGSADAFLASVDTIPPIVLITSPQNGTTVRSATVSVTGLASDDVAVGASR